MIDYRNKRISEMRGEDTGGLFFIPSFNICFNYNKSYNPLIEKLSVLYNQILDCSAVSNADAVIFGANYDEMITWAPFFGEQIPPRLNKEYFCFHSSGKLLLIHIADSIRPAPITKVPVQRYREYFGRRTAIWGGISSDMFLRNCTSDNHFEYFVSRIINTCKPYDNLLLSISDNTLPEADFNRIFYSAETAAKFFKCGGTIEYN